MNGLEILEYTGEGYQPVMAFEQWRVALHNYAECADKDKMKKLERHMCTDEVFVLLEGKATLVIGKEKAAVIRAKEHTVAHMAFHRHEPRRKSVDCGK